MARFCPLFSGSSGNCTYVATAEGGLLIDAGVSAKRIETALAARDVDPNTLRGIFVTHEHSDHTAGVRVLAKRYRLPVYGSVGTLSAIQACVDPSADLRPLPSGGAEVGGMFLEGVPLSHDAREPLGVTVTLPDGRKVTVATDSGVVTPAMQKALTASDVVLIESNHDVGMLRGGAYPYPLKERILSARGHLSNDACAALLPYLVEAGVTQVFLGHLSRENNTPTLARKTALSRLLAAGLAENLDFRLTVAAPQSDEPLFFV